MTEKKKGKFAWFDIEKQMAQDASCLNFTNQKRFPRSSNRECSDKVVIVYKQKAFRHRPCFDACTISHLSNTDLFNSVV